MIVLLQANLPAPPQPFLPLIPEWVFKLAKYIPLTLLFLAIVFGFLWWLYKKQKDWVEPKPYIPEPIPPRQFDPETIYKEIQKVKEAHSQKNTLRLGLHELSFKLRAYLEKITNQEVEEMTSDEITQKFTLRLGSLFKELSLLQFGKTEPNKEEYDKVFDDSIPVLKNFEKERR